MQLTMKFHVTELKHFMGKKTGELEVKIGNKEFRGRSREDLAKNILEWMEKASVAPAVVFAEVGEQHAIFVEYDDGVHTYKVNEGPDGIKKIRSTSYSSDDIKDVAQDYLMHMAQQDWDFEDNLVPPYLTEEQAKEFKSWMAWQLDYQKHLGSGRTPHEAHMLACGYSPIQIEQEKGLGV